MDYCISSPLAAFLGDPDGRPYSMADLVAAVKARCASLDLPAEFRGSVNRELAALIGIQQDEVYDVSRTDWILRHCWTRYPKSF